MDSVKGGMGIIRTGMNSDKTGIQIVNPSRICTLIIIFAMKPLTKPP